MNAIDQMPTVEQGIQDIATRHNREASDVSAWFTEYVNACCTAAHPAMLEPFAEWFADRLESAERFQERKEARIERYEERAEQAKAEANARFNSPANKCLSSMDGQPILIGHHSEKRHRALIARAHNDMDKGCEEVKKAEYYKDKAISASHNGAIMTDDPNALLKLRAKLAELEALQATMKAVNAAHKRFLRKPESLDSSGLSDAYKSRVRDYKPQYSWEPHPFPPYAMSNNNANIKRVRDRIKQLESLVAKQITADAPQETLSGDGWRIVEDVQDNRLCFVFDAKPNESTRERLRACGFKWSPTRGAWVRMLNNSARANAEYVATQLRNGASG